jgi:hypothetical protein
MASFGQLESNHQTRISWIVKLGNNDAFSFFGTLDFFVSSKRPLCSAKTKKDLIHEALKESIRLKKRKDLPELAGAVRFHKNYNHKRF